jgi:hypothetical protein
MARTKAHPLIKEIKSAMMLGQFIPYGDMSEFVQDLESIEKKLEVMAGRDGNHVAVELYETFLAACYEKVEETDDSGGYFGMFFQDLFVGWVKARQAAALPEADTVSQIVKWKQNDCYGLCHEIEKEIGRVLSPVCFDLFAKHFKEQIQAALDNSNISPPLPGFKYPNDIRLPFDTLKNLYESKGSVRKYADVCVLLGFAPRDCERLANLESKRSRWQQALSWIDRGIELESTINWHSESS